MKGKDNERLDKDFVKYCDQIGIIARPTLIKTRKEMHAIQVNVGERKGCAALGECFWHLNTIFIDAGVRIHYPLRSYKGFMRPARERIKHKSKYIDFRNTLVHELVHYRFPNMRHGWRFEQRVIEILRGRTFEPMQILMPPIAVKTQIPKKEYNETLDYFL